ncbi:lysosomal acid lipase/cholesteryl ester hydrolase-like [Bolinopsis microptera]|uniref:lysosomal acid lipase/cholesteryl ester hydrolase-like n=1 Tax=Bolinopsis microptera TaxID=2820187 RepID=UPI003079F077
MSRIAIYESHSPAGTSTRNIVHWSQMVNAQKLQKYDYESVTKNMLHYGSPEPPLYDISGLSVPTVLVMGGNDWLGDPRDQLWLIEQIGHKVVEFLAIDHYNHLDFLWGIDAPKMVYHPMIEIMKKML